MTAGAHQTAQWSYDDFGNRIGANYSGTLADPSQAPPIPGNASATYNANNQAQSASPGPVPTYDSSGDGDMTSDGQNQYLYDAEGRVCAVESLLGRGMYGYLYNAEGVRVAKGTITTFNCNTASNGFQLTASYILGPGNQQLTEMSWRGGTAQWAHTNVWAGGGLLATYAANTAGAPDTYFALTDWLGTKRAEITPDNTLSGFSSLPYGNDLSPDGSAPDATEHHFTGKERDSESGNDYFGARYYASSMGRWLMPDPSGLSYSDPRDPQSLNLYAYVGNHALQYVDPYGLNWFNQAPCSGTYYAQTSLGTAIKSFFAHLFANCGGGGGGGSDPDPFPDTGWPVTKRPFRQPLTQMDVAERVYDVKQNLSKPCKKAYSGVGKRLGVPFSMSTFARSLENGELDQHPNEEPGKYSGADATTDPSGSRTIHTWANFYGLSSNTQGYVLWHELTHKNFRIGDDESNAPGPGLDFNNQFAPYGYGGDYGGGGTAAFTDWLQEGCPAQ